MFSSHLAIPHKAWWLGTLGPVWHTHTHTHTQSTPTQMHIHTSVRAPSMPHPATTDMQKHMEMPTRLRTHTHTYADTQKIGKLAVFPAYLCTPTYSGRKCQGHDNVRVWMPQNLKPQERRAGGRHAALTHTANRKEWKEKGWREVTSEGEARIAESWLAAKK